MNLSKIHKELRLRTSRSSGAGGQHVNKVATRVEVLLEVEASKGLTAVEKRRIGHHLKTRINNEGILMVSCQATRSQRLNRTKAIKKLDALLKKAVRPRPKRKPVKPLRANAKKRLKAKKRRSEKKEWRGKVRLPADR